MYLYTLFVLIAVVKSEILILEPETGVLFEQETIDIQVSLNSTDQDLQIQLILRDDWLTRLRLYNTSLNLTQDQPVQNFTVTGEFLGFAYIDFYYCDNGTCEEFLDTNQTYELAILRKHRTVDSIFTVLILSLVIVANLGMGCHVDLNVIKEVLKRPTGPVIGFMCQFCIMPPLSFLLARVFQLSTPEQIGLLAVGSSPGGGASNMWSLLLNGDVNLSITMTLISTIASLGMFPLWMYTLGKVIMDEAEFHIPFQNILGSLVGIIVPVAIGILLQHKKPIWAKKISKITKPMLFIFLIFIFTFGTWVNWYMFRLFRGILIAASLCLPYIGFASSLCVAALLGQPKKRAITICIETGIQNIGVAIFALRLSLPQPLNDLSLAGSVCPGSFTAIPLLITLIAITINRKCIKKPKQITLPEEQTMSPADQNNDQVKETKQENGVITPQENGVFLIENGTRV